MPSCGRESSTDLRQGRSRAGGAGLVRPVLLVLLPKKRASARPLVARPQHFAKWQLPDDVIWLDELPLTATGKVSKLNLRKQLAEYKHPEVA